MPAHAPSEVISTAASSSLSNELASRDHARAASARQASGRVPPAAAAIRPWRVVKVGMELGNYRTVVAASKDGEGLELGRDVFPNVVGFLKLGAERDGAGGPGDVLFDRDAFELRERLDLRRPIESGKVVDVKIAHALISHVCSGINPSGAHDLWGVVSAPARASAEDQRRVQRAVRGVLARAVVLPEPLLAAEGMHLEDGLRGAGGDLSSGALVIDMAATSTEICLVHGGLPDRRVMLSLEQGGHWIDTKILTNALVHCPGLSLSPRLAVSIKEEQAFVDPLDRDVGDVGAVPSELVALTGVIRRACANLVHTIVDATAELLGRCEPEVATAVVRNVIVTGGGSRMRGLAETLRSLFRKRGVELGRVMVPRDYKRLVARGALRIAETMSDAEWLEAATRHWEPDPIVVGAREASRELACASSSAAGRGEVGASSESFPGAADVKRGGDDWLGLGREEVSDFDSSVLDELELFRALEPSL